MLLIWAIWAVPVGVCVFLPEVGFYLSIVWVLVGYSSLSYVTACCCGPSSGSWTKTRKKNRTGTRLSYFF